jgi:hypothetical protein
LAFPDLVLRFFMLGRLRRALLLAAARLDGLRAFAFRRATLALRGLNGSKWPAMAAVTSSIAAMPSTLLSMPLLA